MIVLNHIKNYIHLVGNKYSTYTFLPYLIETVSLLIGQRRFYLYWLKLSDMELNQVGKIDYNYAMYCNFEHAQ